MHGLWHNYEGEAMFQLIATWLINKLASCHKVMNTIESLHYKIHVYREDYLE